MTDTPTDRVADIRVVMKTSKGDIAIALFASKTPLTTCNFLNLAQRGYYDGVGFHRVIQGFMMQGGDPTGTGSGGPGYEFDDEFRPDLRFDREGLLAMANRGPRTNGSQFFITYVPTPHLNDKHTIFGEVTRGLDVTTQIRNGDRIEGIDILDPADSLRAQQASHIARWNKHLDG